jgi:hypothetical protein
MQGSGIFVRIGMDCVNARRIPPMQSLIFFMHGICKCGWAKWAETFLQAALALFTEDYYCHHIPAPLFWEP